MPVYFLCLTCPPDLQSDPWSPFSISQHQPLWCRVHRQAIFLLLSYPCGLSSPHWTPYGRPRECRWLSPSPGEWGYSQNQERMAVHPEWRRPTPCLLAASVAGVGLSRGAPFLDVSFGPLFVKVAWSSWGSRWSSAALASRCAQSPSTWGWKWRWGPMAPFGDRTENLCMWSQSGGPAVG